MRESTTPTPGRREARRSKAKEVRQKIVMISADIERRDLKRVLLRSPKKRGRHLFLPAANEKRGPEAERLHKSENRVFWRKKERRLKD